MKIFGWSDGGSACEYYRLRVPLDEIERQVPDVEVRISGIYDLEFRPDVVIGQRVSMDGPSELWRRLAAGELDHRPRLIYEIDDDLFEVPTHNPSARHYSNDTVRANIRRNLLFADAITVSTKPLGNRVTSEMIHRTSHIGKTPPVHVIQNALPAIAYRRGMPPIQSLAPTIGWAGSASHVEDFDEVAAPLARFLRQNPAAMFLTMGSDFPNVRKRIDPRQYRVAAWVTNMNQYYQSLDQFDIGIIPLRPSVFNQSKSDIKFLELAARRIPIIASDAGPYSKHSGIADLVRGSHQWGLFLRDWATLLHDGYDPEEHTLFAYEYACERSIWHTWSKWWEVINGTT